MKFILFLSLFFLSMHAASNTLPNDISCCIADLKFDGERIYICEFGEAIESRFKGYDALYGLGSMWHNIWKNLSAFQMPMHYVGKELSYPQKNFAPSSFKRYMSTSSATLQEFERLYKSQQQNTKKNEPLTLFIAHSFNQSGFIRALQAQFPEIIFLGNATNHYVRSKQATNCLFTTPFLKQFKPPTIIIEKKYTPELAGSIMQAIPSDFFVLKPPACALGKGVILISKTELDATLKLIIERSPQLRYQGDSKAYRYWEKDYSTNIMIEAFMPSKIVMAENKPFDPTMRVVFILSNLQGIMNIQYLGCYWKLPVKSLTDAGTFMELHKSSISSARSSSTFVDDADYEKVREQLNALLPVLYEKMLR